MKLLGAGRKPWTLVRKRLRRPPPGAPVAWVRTGPEGGVLYVETGGGRAAQLNLDDDTILEIAAKLRANPGLRELELELLHPTFRQGARIGPRVMPWVRCVFGVLAQEVSHCRRQRLALEGERSATHGRLG
ncbi:MAG: hypothetical protein ACPLRW_05620 [Moorellales bacterium]